MGGFSIIHLLILLVLVPFGLLAFLPLFIKPRGANRFGPPAAPRTFPSAFVQCLKKYADFSGRARRSEYWWYRLAVLLILTAVNIAAPGQLGTLLLGMLSLAFFLPDLAVSVRRLHDLNRSGWWVLLGFTGFGVIALIVLMAWPSQKDDQAQVF